MYYISSLFKVIHEEIVKKLTISIQKNAGVFLVYLLKD